MKLQYIRATALPLFFIFIFLSAAQVNAQVIDWVKSYSGADNEYSAAIASDGSSLYTIGTFTGTAVFGGYTLATVVPRGDIFITKADAATGTVLWAKKFGSQAEDYGTAVTAGPNGDVYITGRFSGTLTLGATAYAATGGSEAFIAKLDPATGNVVWALKMGGTGFDNGSALATDAAGNVYATGYYQGAAAFGTHTLAATGSNYNVFITKVSGATGSVLWAQGMGGTGYNFGNGIACDAAGNVYTTGSMESTAVFGAYTLTSKGNTDIYIAKTNGATGSVLWAKNYGGIGNDSGNGILSKGTAVYATGKFENQVIFDNDTLMSKGSSDGFTIKQDAGSGNILWSGRAGGTGYDASNALSYDLLGNIYTVGQFSGVIVLNNISYYGSGAADAYMARLNDANGAVSWAMQAGGMGVDIGNSITRDASGSIYVTGSFQFNALFEYLYMTAGGGSDVFTFRLNSAIVGINKHAGDANTLTVFPNPFSNELHVALNDNLNPYTIVVTDVTGRLLMLENNTDTLDLGALSAGVYYLTLSGAGRGYITKKIIKN